MLMCWLVVVLGSSAGWAQEPVVWDFESEETGWRPRAETISLTRIEGVGAVEDSRASLRVRGRIDGGWNYAISDTHPMQAGKLYRLSAWLRVQSLGETTPMPYLKCEFVGKKGSGEIGRINTAHYDPQHMGQWQHLVGEFRAPEGTVSCWLALEKGTNAPAEIDAVLDEVKLQEIEQLSVLERYRLKPSPAPLEAVRGVHPRIYLTSERIAELREAIKGTHAALWEEMRAQADDAVKRGAPKYIRNDKWSGDEQLWQRDVGNKMPLLAMAYVLSGERKYLESARAWALASCSYETWGLGRIDGMDLATGHQLLGLGIVYDWCYDDLGDQARQTIRETIVRRTSAMFEAAATDKVWWRRSYLQNHLWVNICGMAVAGLAVFDEVDDASLWIGLPLEKFQRTMKALGHDGASHEGVGYWEYGVEYMLKFMYLARELLDVNMFDNPWWGNTAAYCLYLTLPRNAWTRGNSIVDIADCPRYHWYGPDHLLRALAAQYHDGYAQWLAWEIDNADIEAASARWLNLIWFDPSIRPKPPTDRPTLHHFDDIGIVSARSDWSGDESLVVFKCGPYIGHKALQEFNYDPGGGHVHPDANHFVVFGGGEWLIRDDGYQAKQTGQHNTLLIEGEGQLGEGHTWFSGAEALRLKASPKITRATSNPLFDHITGDATEAYPPNLGLRRFVRHLLFIKPNVLIVLDDIATEAPKHLELRFHPQSSEAVRDDRAYLIRGQQTTLRIEPVTVNGVAVHAEEISGAGRHGKPFSMYTIRLTTDRDKWRNAVALSWSSGDRNPPIVTLDQRGNDWVFSIGTAKVTFNWKTGEAVVSR